MRVDDFNYVLPTDRIASHPPKTRGQARLLVLDRQTGAIDHQQYSNLENLLHEGDVLVLNNTKVIKARLIAKNAAGFDQELLLTENHGSTDETSHLARVVYRGKLAVGDELTLEGSVISVENVLAGGLADISSTVPIYALAEKSGYVPLPPYMKREATKSDIKRYQTTFAAHAGSVAAPTASLNMTDELIKTLEAKGVIVSYLTLHVGLGTFLPIRVDDFEKHKMHSEFYTIPSETRFEVALAKGTGRRVVALGTTVARTLEYAAADLHFPGDALTGEADIFIYPGYEFQVVDALITNFHAPRSTVLMLAAACAGWPHLLEAYRQALAADYRFLSYGDSMFIQ